MSLPDQYDQMTPAELWEQMELRFPERIAQLEADYQDIIEAIVEDELESVDQEELDEFLEDIRELLAV